jgi:hypothetical protein
MDPYAELADQDEDLLLNDVAGLDLLLAAADRPECPKRAYCGVLLEVTARDVTRGPAGNELEALRAAVARAGQGRYPIVRAWAAYVQRLFGYREPHGHVNRATAERMAADLFAGPIIQKRLSGTE